MNVRFRFKSAAGAEEAASKLPVGCKWSILRDCTSDAYLEVSGDYEDYVEKYLYKPYREQERCKCCQCLFYEYVNEEVGWQCRYMFEPPCDEFVFNL